MHCISVSLHSLYILTRIETLTVVRGGQSPSGSIYSHSTHTIPTIVVIRLELHSFTLGEMDSAASHLTLDTLLEAIGPFGPWQWLIYLVFSYFHIWSTNHSKPSFISGSTWTAFRAASINIAVSFYQIQPPFLCQPIAHPAWDFRTLQNKTSAKTPTKTNSLVTWKIMIFEVSVQAEARERRDLASRWYPSIHFNILRLTLKVSKGRE